MSTTRTSSVVLADLSFAWPDGTVPIHGIDASFDARRTGLIGANGSGKTTLLRLIRGELAPRTGSVAVSGSIGWLPQQLALRSGVTVAEVLGVAPKLDALRAIEAGDADPRHFDVLADDWDVRARARTALDGSGLGRIALDRPVGSLSGGETVLAALAGLRLHRFDVVLLDEPTNDLDRDARHRLYDAMADWRGAVIVVSHDVVLLDLMDETAELRTGSLTLFGGGYSAYRAHLEQEQAAATQALRTAHQKLKVEERQRIDAQTKLARRRRYALNDYEHKRKPKVIMNQRRSEAQVSAGKLRGEVDRKVLDARTAAEEQAGRVREDARVRITLPDPGVAAARRLAELRDDRGTTVVLQGPERLALTGRNGIGKTCLLEMLVHGRDRILAGDADRAPVRAFAHTDRIGYLPQRSDHLDEEITVLDAVRSATPEATPAAVRASLARFLFRGDAVQRRVADLSGGERFRVALARLLLAEPSHQLLVMDEPTNNLDLDTVDALVSALEEYHGGVVVVSHDDAFLARLRIDTRVRLDESGLRREA